MENFFAENLALLRKSRKHTQAEAASLLGLKRTTYANYENKHSEPNIEALGTIARYYGWSIDDLVFKDWNSVQLMPEKETIKKDSKNGIDVHPIVHPTVHPIPEKPPVSEKAEVMEKLRKIEADVKENFGKTGPYNVYDFDGHAAAGQAIALLEDDKKRGEPNMYLPGLGPGLHIRISAAGESMFPSIKPGDKPVATWVSKLSEVHPGGVYILIDANDGAVCKRLYKEGKTHFRLESDNEMFQPYKRHLEDVLAVFRVREVHSTDLRPYMLDVRRDIRVLQAQMEEMQAFIHQK